MGSSAPQTCRTFDTSYKLNLREMGTYLNPIEQLEHRITMLEQRVKDLETVGKPKYGLTNVR